MLTTRTLTVVVNLVDEDLVEGMNRCAAALPYGQSELDFAGEGEEVRD